MINSAAKSPFSVANTLLLGGRELNLGPIGLLLPEETSKLAQKVFFSIRLGISRRQKAFSSAEKLKDPRPEANLG